MNILLASPDPTEIHVTISLNPVSLKDASVGVLLDGSHCMSKLLFFNLIIFYLSFSSPCTRLV